MDAIEVQTNDTTDFSDEQYVLTKKGTDAPVLTIGTRFWNWVWNKLQSVVFNKVTQSVYDSTTDKTGKFFMITDASGIDQTLINDNVTASDTSWSSNKITTQINSALAYLNSDTSFFTAESGVTVNSQIGYIYNPHNFNLQRIVATLTNNTSNTQFKIGTVSYKPRCNQAIRIPVILYDTHSVTEGIIDVNGEVYGFIPLNYSGIVIISNLDYIYKE